MKIHQTDVSDILQRLPDLKPFDPHRRYDLLVCTLGFEDRSHAVIDALCKSGAIRATQIVLLQYPTNQKDNNSNSKFFQRAAKLAKSYREVVYSRTGIAESLRNVLSNELENPCESICFDVSTCSSYVFYPTIRELMRLEAELTIAYSEASIYHPTAEEWRKVAQKADKEQEETLYVRSFEEANFQSIGVENVYASNVFSEMNPGNHPTVLVAVPNFNVSRMNAIIERDREINKTEYDNIWWIIGTPPSEKMRWRVDALEKTNGISGSRSNRKKAVSTLTYKDMLMTLEDLWIRSKNDFHMSIACLGSKMQHLGIFLFMFLHQDVGLWMAEPISFQAKLFSTGFGEIHQIEFGRVKTLAEILSTYQLFEWEL